jgi:membrane protein DedA with SNARE-associated domain
MAASVGGVVYLGHAPAEIPRMMYLAVFAGALIMDLVPIIAPPAWSVMLWLLVKYDLSPWLVLLAGVPGSALGRYIFSLYVVKGSDKFIKRHKHAELLYLGKKLGPQLWPTWLFVFLYTLTPLSTSALFTAAGMAKVPAVRTIPPFFVGKFISDAVMIFAGRYAVGSFSDTLGSAFSAKGILFMVLGLAIIGSVLFIDWFSLLQRKKLRFDFKIWK